MNICVWNYESWSRFLRSHQSSFFAFVGAQHRGPQRAAFACWGGSMLCPAHMLGYLPTIRLALTRAVILPALTKEGSEVPRLLFARFGRARDAVEGPLFDVRRTSPFL